MTLTAMSVKMTDLSFCQNGCHFVGNLHRGMNLGIRARCKGKKTSNSLKVKSVAIVTKMHTFGHSNFQQARSVAPQGL